MGHSESVMGVRCVGSGAVIVYQVDNLLAPGQQNVCLLLDHKFIPAEWVRL